MIQSAAPALPRNRIPLSVGAVPSGTCEPKHTLASSQRRDAAPVLTVGKPTNSPPPSKERRMQNLLSDPLAAYLRAEGK